MHHTFAREHAPAIVHQCTAQRAFIKSHRHLIGKPGEHAARDRPWLGFALLNVETLGPSDGQELLPELSRFTRRTAVDSEARTVAWVEVIPCREKIGRA